MGRYFLIAFLAHLRTGRTLFALTVGGVALGVASVLCIQILNRNALSAFSGSVEAITGDADVSIVPRGPSLDERLFPRVLGTEGVRGAWPLLRVDVVLESPLPRSARGAAPSLGQATYLELFGVDFFAPVRFPLRADASETSDSTTISLRAALLEPGWVAITPEFARELGVRQSDSLRVSSGSKQVTLRVGALVDFRKYTPTASRRLAVMDIAQAQSLFGRPGEIDEIAVQCAPEVTAAVLCAALTSRLGPNVEVLTPEQRDSAAAGLLQAFRLNLTALSLISLFVGVFLVYSSLQAALLRRRAEFGLLRSLGATRGQVLGIVWAEVLVIAVLGVAVGLPLGLAAARANLQSVNGTLSNLYLLEAMETLVLPHSLWILAGAVGLLGAFAGAVVPALDLARRDVRALLVAYSIAERITRAARPLASVGTGLLLATGLWFWLFGHGTRAAGFVLALCLVVALPLLTPIVLQTFSRFTRVSRLDLGYALHALGARPQTTAPAVAALGLAVSMLIAVTLLIGSFRQTVVSWIEGSIRADIFVTTRSWSRAGGDAALDPALESALRETGGVRAIDRLRQVTVTRRDGGRVRVSGVEMGLDGGEARFPLLEGTHAQAMPLLRDQGWIVMGEPLARASDLHVGDSLHVFGRAGPLALPIAAVCYDYSTEAGSIAMDLRTFERHFGPGPIQNLALYLNAGVEAEATVDALKARFAGRPLEIRSNRTLRNEVLRIFDQTFAVTRVLQVMSLLIAAAGVALTLLVLARERVAELGLYRALGASQVQLFGLFLGEGIGIGLLGLGLGLGGGLGLAGILVFVINRDWFGWTIRFTVPWPDLLIQIVTIVCVAAAAGIYPAVRASRVSAEVLAREDV